MHLSFTESRTYNKVVITSPHAGDGPALHREQQIPPRAELSQQAQKKRLSGALFRPRRDDNSIVLAALAGFNRGLPYYFLITGPLLCWLSIVSPGRNREGRESDADDVAG